MTPELIMDIIDRHRVTRTIFAPFFAAILLKSNECRQLKSIETLMVGGQKAPGKLLKEIQNNFPSARLYVLYGSTEMDIISSSFGGSKENCAGQVTYNNCIKVRIFFKLKFKTI